MNIIDFVKEQEIQNETINLSPYLFLGLCEELLLAKEDFLLTDYIFATEFYYDGFHVVKEKSLPIDTFIVGDITSYGRNKNAVKKFKVNGEMIKELL